MREAGVLEAIKGVTAGESLLGGNVVVHPCRYVVASSAGFAGKIPRAGEATARRSRIFRAVQRWILNPPAENVASLNERRAKGMS